MNLNNKKLKFIRLCQLIILFIIFGINLSASDKFPNLYKGQPKKKIFFGHDAPTIKEFRKNIKEIEKNIPADGIGIDFELEVMKNGKKYIINKYSIMQPDYFVWKREWFKPLISDLKVTKSTKLTDNFIKVCTYPGKVDWFDDRAWKNVCNKFAILAWLAKEGNCKGIVLDTEYYGGKHIFQYNPSTKHSFRETWEKVRQRGQEYITAVCKEYPNITIFNWFWLGALWGEQNFQDHGEGLVVAFANGVYDKLYPDAKIIDGYEHGYTLSRAEDFYSVSRAFNIKSQYLLYPSNINKFKTQTSLAIPLYIDSYVNKSGRWQKKTPKGMTKLDLFSRNVSLALENSGEYIWCYGEQGKWWNKKYTKEKQKALLKTFGKGRLWEKIMPGITKVLESAGDPLKYALSELNAGKLKKELVLNESFENGFKNWLKVAPGLISRERSKAVYGKFTVRTCLSKEISLNQNVKIKPNSKYLVTASWRTMRKGRAFIEIKLINSEDNVKKQISLAKGAENIKWKTVSAVVKTPPNASYINIDLTMKSNSGDYYDRCYFDNIAVYELPENFKESDSLALKNTELKKNLVVNGGFELDDSISGWKSRKSGGFIKNANFAVDGKYSVQLHSMKRATLRQIIPVKPYNKFLLRVCCRKRGKVHPKVIVSWKNLNNVWLRGGYTLNFSEHLKNDWLRAYSIISVPPNVGYLGLHLVMTSPEANSENVCYFDNVELYNLK